MAAKTLTLSLLDPNKTAQHAAVLGGTLQSGDVVLLSGVVGAGKTHFARSLIQSQLSAPEDVPSPTFTLVQTYETKQGEIWHADLYRLTDPQEIEELGLIEAFETAICLIEWPDRLADLAPHHALSLSLRDGDQPDARILSAEWRDPKWDTKLDGWRT